MDDTGHPDAEMPDAPPGDDAGDRDASLLPPTGPLGLSDVSTLFPLPTTLASGALLRLDAAGVDGALLSVAQFEALGAFPVDDAELGYAQFRVVAARIDPCFPSLALLDSDPGACRRQLRLVAQPLFAALDETTRAHDSAVHLLYDLSPSDFEAVVAELVAIRGARPFDPLETLEVHPVLVAEGESGAYGASLRAWIVAHAGAGTLSQVTFVRGDSNFSWRFGGFRVETDGSLSPLEIPVLDPVSGDVATSQAISLDSGLSGPSGDTTGVSGVAPSGDVVRSIRALFGVRRASMGMPYWEYEGDVVAAIGAAHRIENPTELDTDTADCASCHLAGQLRARAERLGYVGDDRLAYGSGWDLTRPATPMVSARPNVTRAFGYFDGHPVISQRTINESAAVADRLNADL